MEENGVSYPGGEFNYSDGRLTNSRDTDPASDQYFGVWHEQLAHLFLKLPTSAPSLDGGNDFAFSGATTERGTRDYSIIDVFGLGVTVTIDNMGRQVNDYLAKRTVDPAALFAVWGGGNDLFDDHSSSNVTAAAGRMAMMISSLANAGARHFLVPNVPPLGGLPRYANDPEAKDAMNSKSALYRAELDASLDSVTSTLAAQGIKIEIDRLDVWSLFVRFVSDPKRYGFTDMMTLPKARPSTPTSIFSGMTYTQLRRATIKSLERQTVHSQAQQCRLGARSTSPHVPPSRWRKCLSGRLHHHG